VYNRAIGVESDLPGSVSAEPGQWYHLAVVYKNTTATMYVNGALAGSATDFPQSSSIDNNRVFNYFGQDMGGQFINAQLDEIRFYNRALTQTQVKTDMYVLGRDLDWSRLCF
jgi:hypothetical protein